MISEEEGLSILRNWKTEQTILRLISLDELKPRTVYVSTVSAQSVLFEGVDGGPSVLLALTDATFERSEMTTHGGPPIWRPFEIVLADGARVVVDKAPVD